MSLQSGKRLSPHPQDLVFRVVHTLLPVSVVSFGLFLRPKFELFRDSILQVVGTLNFSFNFNFFSGCLLNKTDHYLFVSII